VSCVPRDGFNPVGINICITDFECPFSLYPGNMDKYRLVEEKFIGAQGFIDDNKDTDIVREKELSGGLDAQCIVRITQQAKPRSCITTAMNMLVRVAASH
jgi:hypothetical protein